MSLDFALLTINRKAVGLVSPYRILKAGAADGEVVQASLATDKFVAVSGHVGGTDAQIDVHVAGIVPVQYGGVVAFGDQLTSDADGKAVVAADGQRVIGIAQEGGDLDAIGSVQIAHGFLKTL